MMNETYIKRQLTLHSLGIPISGDIQNYYDDFNLLFKSLGKLKKERKSKEVITWSKGYNIIINYDYEKYEFWSADFFESYLKSKYGLTPWETHLLLNIFFGYIFNLEVEMPEDEDDDMDFLDFEL